MFRYLSLSWLVVLCFKTEYDSALISFHFPSPNFSTPSKRQRDSSSDHTPFFMKLSVDMEVFARVISVRVPAHRARRSGAPAPLEGLMEVDSSLLQPISAPDSSPRSNIPLLAAPLIGILSVGMMGG